MIKRHSQRGYLFPQPFNSRKLAETAAAWLVRSLHQKISKVPRDKQLTGLEEDVLGKTSFYVILEDLGLGLIEARRSATPTSLSCRSSVAALLGL